MTFWVIAMESYLEKAAKLDSSYRRRVEQFIDQLGQYGDVVGKPLGLPFLREKKFNGNRLFYLVYGEWKVILLVTIGDKKEQSAIIEYIKANLDYYRSHVIRCMRNEN